MMKVRISITLSDDLVARIDHLAGDKDSRSALIERWLRRAVRLVDKRRTEREEVEKLNRMADWLVEHGENDLLEYQADPFEAEP